MNKLASGFVALLFVSFTALAAPPPQYFVDEAKLPFAPLQGLDS